MEQLRERCGAIHRQTAGSAMQPLHKIAVPPSVAGVPPKASSVGERVHVGHAEVEGLVATVVGDDMPA